jgi:hypothetical protein
MPKDERGREGQGETEINCSIFQKEKRDINAG